MARKLTFEIISDERSDGSKNKLKEMTSKIDIALGNLAGVTFQKAPMREVKFAATRTEPSHLSFRRRYFVTKTGRKTTWNDVYAAVNTVYTPYYEFQN